jgi:hypothetical protein
MMISTLIATSIATLVLATGGTLAEDAATPPTFQQVVATMNDVEWTIHQIDTIRDVSNVRLVQLDDSMGENEQAFIGVVAVQQGTAQVDALRSAIAENRRLVAQLDRLHIEYMNIVAVDISEFGAITVYTFGARA